MKDCQFLLKRLRILWYGGKQGTIWGGDLNISDSPYRRWLIYKFDYNGKVKNKSINFSINVHISFHINLMLLNMRKTFRVKLEQFQYNVWDSNIYRLNQDSPKQESIIQSVVL